MSVEERLDRLEQRLQVLEVLVRELARGAVERSPGAWPRPVRRSAREDTPPAAAPPSGGGGTPDTAGTPAGGPAPAAEAPTGALTGAGRPAAPALAAEQWIGQRGLLAVGVLALLLAAGYLLKLSFERGWISPLVRCTGGALAGAAVGAVGWHLLARYRTYGAALVGCGAGIIYLAVWAASRLYGFLPPASGIAALALLSLGLATIAYAVEVEALGTTAALGAFFAPVLLGRRRADADLLLVYLGFMALGLGWVAARRRWRTTSIAVALSYFGLGWSAVALARPARALLYTVVGGAGGTYLGLREGWWETRLLAFWGGWALLATMADRSDPPWLVLLAGLVLAAPVWWHGFRRPAVAPLRLLGAPASPDAGWSVGEAIYFFATPFLLAWAVRFLAPDRFALHPGLAPLAVAAPYLAAGYLGRRPPFALVGAGALGAAALRHWSGVEAPAVLLLLALIWAGLDHLRGRRDGRWYAAATLAVAVVHLLGTDRPRRALDDPAFVGSWALVLWLAAAVAAALAAGLWRREPGGEASRVARSGLWLLAGGLVLFGVTGEIQRYFRLHVLSPGTGRLAAGLAVSAWWLVVAGALVATGLKRRLRPARLAGLTVAGLAVLKVLVFDLASLDALYRVASVLLLGLVSLGLAYLYHRQAGGSGA